MRQVLTRRYSKMAEAIREAKHSGTTLSGSARLPDLVLVDGGKGQVSMAKEVFESLGLDLSLIVGVEKAKAARSGSRSWCLPMGATRSIWEQTRRL